MSGQKLLAKMLVTQFAHLNGPKKSGDFDQLSAGS